MNNLLFQTPKGPVDAPPEENRPASDVSQIFARFRANRFPSNREESRVQRRDGEFDQKVFITPSASLGVAEEWPVDGIVERKMPARMILIIVVVIIVLFSTIYFLSRDEVGWITALEGNEIADQTALNWNSSAELVEIRSYSIDNNGYSVSWRYVYTSSSTPSNLVKGLEVLVFSNGSFNVNELPNPPSFIPISNWVIDSSEIVETAKENSAVSSYLSEYPNADISVMALVGQNESGLNCLWTIEWVDEGWLDNPHWTRIRLNGTTGEVVEVEF